MDDELEKASQGKYKSVVFDIVTAFSLFKSLSTILSTKQPPFAIQSLNGIRVISMFWIIWLHTLVFLVIGGADNQLYVYNNVVHHFSFLAIGNIIFSVDNFFFLSSILASYLTLCKMAKSFSVVRYYLHRYLRLTPTMAFMLFFRWFLSVHLAAGPNYQAETGVDSPMYTDCEKYWWTHFLYISNFHPSGCYRETWYLSTDMQFYLVSPLMILLLYYNRQLGLICVGVFLLASFAITAALVSYYGFDASYPGLLFLGMLQIAQRQQRLTIFTSEQIYSQPFARISPYLIGIVLGYVFYIKATIPFNKRLLYPLIWALAVFLCISVICIPYGSWHGLPLTPVGNILYFTFSRFAWSIGLALVVFACHNGYGWLVNSFLSAKFWLPLSRLTFAAYLVHPIVIDVVRHQLREPLHYTDITMVVYVAAVVVLSYGSAGLVGAFVEIPLGNLEAIFFKQLDLCKQWRQAKPAAGRVEREDIALPGTTKFRHPSPA